MSVLAPEKRDAVIAALRVGKGVRETARETGVNKTTVTKIGADLGLTFSHGYRPAKKPMLTASMMSDVKKLVEQKKEAVRRLQGKREQILSEIAKAELMILEIDELLVDLGVE